MIESHNTHTQQPRMDQSTYLFEIADCDDPVLIHDAVDIVDLILPDAFPRFSKSPVLLCFFNFKP